MTCAKQAPSPCLAAPDRGPGAIMPTGRRPDGSGGRGRGPGRSCARPHRPGPSAVQPWPPRHAGPACGLGGTLCMVPPFASHVPAFRWVPGGVPERGGPVRQQDAGRSIPTGALDGSLHPIRDETAVTGRPTKKRNGTCRQRPTFDIGTLPPGRGPRRRRRPGGDCRRDRRRHQSAGGAPVARETGGHGRPSEPLGAGNPSCWTRCAKRRWPTCPRAGKPTVCGSTTFAEPRSRGCRQRATASPGFARPRATGFDRRPASRRNTMPRRRPAKGRDPRLHEQPGNGFCKPATRPPKRLTEK